MGIVILRVCLSAQELRHVGGELGVVLEQEPAVVFAI
jgi:hypothetical protein